MRDLDSSPTSFRKSREMSVTESVQSKSICQRSGSVEEAKERMQVAREKRSKRSA